MSLSHIPFQPVHFGELPEDCGSSDCNNGNSCLGVVGGTYSNKVQYNDYTSFQLRLDLCEDATQLLDNPNFANSESVQFLSNPNFDDGLTDWSFVSGSGSVVDGVLEFTSTNNILRQGATTPTAQILVEVDILANDGTISIYNDGDNPETTETGTFTAIITPPVANEVVIYCDGNTASKITAVRAYSLPDIEDWSSQDPAVVLNGIVTISGNGSISQQSTLSANTTYLFRVNVVDLIGEAVFITTSAETFPITSVGVHEFVMTTGATPVVSIYASNQQASIQFVEAYEWFGASDITIELYDCDDTLIYTLTDGTKLISANTLTVSFNWGEIIVDDEGLPEGCYYLKVTDGCGDEAVSMDSQPFSLAATHDCTYKITACMDNDAFGFEFDNFTPTLRIEYKWSDARWPNERERFNDSVNRSLTNWGKVDEILTLITEDVPRYIQRFIGLWPVFNTIWLGNERYDVDNISMDLDPNKEYPTWGTFDIEFKLVDYDLSMVKCDDTVKNCAPPPNCWLWPDGEEIDWPEDEGCVLYN